LGPNPHIGRPGAQLGLEALRREQLRIREVCARQRRLAEQMRLESAALREQARRVRSEQSGRVGFKWG
jgi:hypothetical protein